MALKFRRGTTAQKSGSLAFGEPYVNTTLGTLQVGLDTGDVTLATQGTSSLGQFGAISGSGLDITGNANIAGNLTLGGNITIGDQTSDTVTVTANLSSSLIPSVTNTFDLGSSTKIWRDLYLSTGSIKLVDGSGNLVNTITNANIVTTDKLSSGSITLTSSLPAGTVSGSSQVVDILGSLNTYTGSNDTKWNTIGNLTGSYATTGSNTLNGIQHINGAIEIHSGSNPEIRLINTTTNIEYHIQNGDAGNFQIHNGTTGKLLFKFQSGSIADGNQDASYYGNLYVSKSIDTHTVYATDISASTAIFFSGITGSIAATNGVVSGSSQIIGILSSLNTYTASNDTTNTTQNGRLSRLEESTASLNAFSASQLTKDSTLQTYTASIDTKFSTLQTLTASVQSQINRIQESTASLNEFSASNGNTSLNSFTSSINTTIKNRLDAETVISGSSQVTLSATTGFTSYSSSVDSRILTEKGRVDAILLAADADKDSFAEIVTLINSIDTTNDNAFASFYTASVNRLNNLESTSASLAIETANLESFTSSINTTIKNKLNTDGVISGSSQVNFTQLSGISNGIVSGSSQVTPLLPTGTISGSAQLTSSYDGRYELQGRSVVSGSAQVVSILTSLNSYTASNDTTNTTQNSRLDQLSTASGSAISRLNTLESETLNLELFTSSINTTIKSKLDTDGVISSSAQLTSSLVQVSQTSSMNVLSANTVAVVNTVTTTDSTLYPTFTNNIVNATVQLKSHPSGTFYYDGVSRKVYAESFVGVIEATNGVVSGSSQITAGSTTNFATDVKTQLNSNTVVSGSSQVDFTQLSGISANIISASSDTSNVDMIINGGSISANLYGGVVSGSAQVVGMLASLNAYTASNDTTNTNQSNKLSRLEESTASLNTFSSSINGHVSDINTKTGSFENKFTTLASYTASIDEKHTTLASVTASLLSSQGNLNTYTASLNNAIQLTGSTVSFLGNIVVYGTQSVINSQNVEIADNILYLAPTASVDNDLGIVGHYNDGTYRHAGIFMDASDGHAWKVFNGLTQETIGTVDTSGTGFTLADFKAGAFTGTSFTGIHNGTINSTNGVVSGSSQIDITATTNYATGIKTQLNTNTVVSGSSQIDGASLGSNKTITIGSTAITLGGTATTISGLTSVSSTGFTGALTGNASTATTLQTARTINGTSFNGSADITIANLVSGSSQITAGSTANWATDVKTQLNNNTVVSGSSQIAHDSTTGYSANRHIDHTAVSITAGSGLTGGGDISTTRTISIANLGVTDAMLAGSISNAKLSNSAITIAGQSTSLGGSVTAETIRTAIGTVVTGSAQIAIASTSGFGTYINQAVLTTSSPTFAGLTINGSITATGDITAYYTSDKRHKNNIQIIPNALQKVSKLNGVTWEWNDDVNEVTKATPKTGLIAQEVQEVLPEVVREREDGFLSLDYSKMVGLLVEAIKEQQSQIHNLTLQVENLKKQKGL